jgi:hypothetical protein
MKEGRAILEHYTVADVPRASELLLATAVEARRLADEVDLSVRKRLLVVAHITQLLSRELAAAETGSANDRVAARQFAAAIRAGDHDHELRAIVAQTQPEVRARVDVSAPGYAD